MKADEIMQVLRLTAMGRVNTPMQQEFADKLEALFADERGMVEFSPGLEVSAEEVFHALPGSIIPATQKRRKKAE